MVDNKSDVDSPTPFATGSTSRAETSTVAAGSTGHSTSSHEHHYGGHHAGEQHSHEHHADISEDEQISGTRGASAPDAAQQASDREPAEGGDYGDGDPDAMDDTMRRATGAGEWADLIERTGAAGFSPGTEGGLGDGAAAGGEGSQGGDPSQGANAIGETSPAPAESRPPEQL